MGILRQSLGKVLDNRPGGADCERLAPQPKAVQSSDVELIEKSLMRSFQIEAPGVVVGNWGLKIGDACACAGWACR